MPEVIVGGFGNTVEQFPNEFVVTGKMVVRKGRESTVDELLDGSTVFNLMDVAFVGRA